jgi:hypothetical protein
MRYAFHVHILALYRYTGCTPISYLCLYKYGRGLRIPAQISRTLYTRQKKDKVSLGDRIPGHRIPGQRIPESAYPGDIVSRGHCIPEQREYVCLLRVVYFTLR